MISETKTYPLVSVLISTYNRPQTLPVAVASALNQTYPNIEVIVVRDGGKPVREVLAPFLDDSRLKFIDRSINRGKPYSFNEALQQVRGEFICYLDDDDLYYPFHIELLASALCANDHIGAVYTDLYKVHCNQTADGWRQVLAKNVEISRDFDRMLLLQFNNVLHVSLMHRRELLEKTGLYNEHIRVLIDWDMTRRLCFYTDFLHIPIVSGEFYAPVSDSDRISVQQRKKVEDYVANLMAIRSTRPAKPWDKIHDLAVIAPYGSIAERQETLRVVWGHSFYPCQYYLPVRPSEQNQVNIHIPNVIQVSVPQQTTEKECVALCLARVDAPLTAIVPNGLSIDADQSAFLERSLQPLLIHPDPMQVYEIVEYEGGVQWGGVGFTETLRQAAVNGADVSFGHRLRQLGVHLTKPQFEQYPFVFDTYMIMAQQRLSEGDWRCAVQIYDHLVKHFGNYQWVGTLKSYALYRGGQYQAALQTLQPIAEHFPTVSRLHLQGKIYQKLQNNVHALKCFCRATQIIEGHSSGLTPLQARQALSFYLTNQQNQHDVQEPLQWTH